MKRKKPKEFDAELEEVLGSRGRLRILKCLIKNPTGETALSSYRLMSLTGMKRGNVEKNLETLVRWGWVEKIPINGGTKYRLNRNKSEVKSLIEFFRVVGYV